MLSGSCNHKHRLESCRHEQQPRRSSHLNINDYLGESQLKTPNPRRSNKPYCSKQEAANILCRNWVILVRGHPSFFIFQKREIRALGKLWVIVFQNYDVHGDRAQQDSRLTCRSFGFIKWQLARISAGFEYTDAIGMCNLWSLRMPAVPEHSTCIS